MAQVHHEERCPDNARLKGFLAQWKIDGPFDIVLTWGDRNDAQCAALYAQGRTVPGKIVTMARRGKETPHGHRGAFDANPVRELFPMGGVKSIYLGDEEDPVVRAEAQRRFQIFCDRVRATPGLQTGADFPGLHDFPHVQDKEWLLLPLGPGVAA